MQKKKKPGGRLKPQPTTPLQRALQARRAILRGGKVIQNFWRIARAFPERDAAMKFLEERVAFAHSVAFDLTWPAPEPEIKLEVKDEATPVLDSVADLVADLIADGTLEPVDTLTAPLFPEEVPA